MKKSKNSMLYVCVFLSYFVFAQKKESGTTTNPSLNTSNSYIDIEKLFALKERIFKDGLRYGDLDAAKHALFEMILLKPEKKSLKDSLAYIYINMGQLQQAILLSREILESDPNNLSILEVKAIAEQNLGMSKESLSSYEALYTKTKSVFHLYQIATLQYDLKRVAECSMSLDQILNSQEANDKEINIGTGNRGQQQRVKLKAAALNVKGVLAMDVNELKLAQNSFTEALRLTNDFILAQNNLNLVNQKLAASNPTTKPATKTTTKK